MVLRAVPNIAVVERSDKRDTVHLSFLKRQQDKDKYKDKEDKYS